MDKQWWCAFVQLLVKSTELYSIHSRHESFEHLVVTRDRLNIDTCKGSFTYHCRDVLDACKVAAYPLCTSSFCCEKL